MRGVALGLALGVVISIVVSCGGAQPPPSNTDKHTQIAILWGQIRDWRREAKMPLDPPRSLMMQFLRSPVLIGRVCKDLHEVPKTCDDVCGLSDAICDNAEAICGLADELGKDDTFAQEKCASAKASCHEAKQRCCDCSGAVQ